MVGFMAGFVMVCLSCRRFSFFGFSVYVARPTRWFLPETDEIRFPAGSLMRQSGWCLSMASVSTTTNRCVVKGCSSVVSVGSSIAAPKAGSTLWSELTRRSISAENGIFLVAVGITEIAATSVLYAGGIVDARRVI